ncbi:hypothetical protein H5410_027841 [Solanum commersonii]|uniref:Ycf2 N-terminal domain-containing protein n=1 Tax=Solanum commersonii TaxID=4109 RepID=A0A9J5Z2C8_SOLCO|nr:hypothetical protein H5410_027841 [Solanum commersonii]
MESIPNIYAMVSYFDRVQIYKFDILRYFFRPISNTKYYAWITYIMENSSKNLCPPQWNLISDISSKCLHNLLLPEEMIH